MNARRNLRRRIRAAVVWGRRDEQMPVGVVDVGSNTVRLLVGRPGRPILTRRELLRLGDDVERLGTISHAKFTMTCDVVREYADTARAAGVRDLNVLITSPGRQAANGRQLADALERAASFPAHILSAADEARLAFVGAMEGVATSGRRRVGVVDVGGGSAQLAVGTRGGGSEWIHSIDLGTQRLTTRVLAGDPPGSAAVEAARREASVALADLALPEVSTAYAVGGSARALKRIVGSRLGAEELANAAERLATTPSAQVAVSYGIDPGRARTLAAGAVILAELQALFDRPLEVVRGGLRDGALSELARRAAA
jgi:exopolyphosphatase/guanosine-5'-triphosphate,3'-diphosphate pyrophosphatase